MIDVLWVVLSAVLAVWSTTVTVGVFAAEKRSDRFLLSLIATVLMALAFGVIVALV